MRRSKNRRLMGNMNVVPYIDVMLVLLIIFMVTAPLMQQGVQVDLPETGGEPLDPDILSENESLVVSIDAAGNFYLNTGEDPQAPVTEDQIRETASAVLRVNAETPMIINADGAALHARVTMAMVLLTEAGAPGVSVLTDPVAMEDF